LFNVTSCQEWDPVTALDDMLNQVWSIYIYIIYRERRGVERGGRIRSTRSG